MTEIHRNIEYIVVHHSDGWFGTLDYINGLHEKRGFPKGGLGYYAGYHKICLNGYADYKDLDEKKYRRDLDGKVVTARDDDDVGAHVHGLNSNSLGICLIGRFNSLLPSIFQMNSVLDEVFKWAQKYAIKTENILGHCEAQGLPGKSFVLANDRKTCPGSAIDMCWIREQIWRMLK